jgi:hypothetical protein
MFEDDFDEDDFDNYEPSHPEKLPIYQKGKEILDLVREIAALIPEDNEQLQWIKGAMISDAAQLSIKVAGAEGGGLYGIRMECAAFIRKAARDLMTTNHSLESFGFQHVDYFYMVRDLIEEYRVLFVEWVAGFDKFNALYDDWGLFNPPGVDLSKDFW